MPLYTFEDRLVSPRQKWDYALGNVACDADGIPAQWREQFERVAEAFYPGYKQREPVRGVLMLNVLLPGGCNATCPGICYTDWQAQQPSTKKLSRKLLMASTRDFQALGGKIIRIVGVGEPTLSRDFLPLCEVAAELGIALVVFSNGVTLSKRIAQEYERNPCLYFYLKHWSDREEEQNRLVQPKPSYRYVEGMYGSASHVLYDLLERDPNRVGLQVMVAQPNLDEVKQIIASPKQYLPIFLEPFIPAGAGKLHPNWVVDNFPVTKSCDNPTRASYLAVVNQRGELQAGTFVEEDAMPLTEQGFRAIWDSAFTTQRVFFQARYHGQGCFCELMRNKVQHTGFT